MLSFILLLMVVIICLYSWISLLLDRKKTNVPGPFPFPILGNAHRFMVKSSKFLSVMGRLENEYKDAVIIHLFSTRYMLFSHPKYVEAIVSSAEMITKGLSYKFMQPWLGLGLLTASGQRWKTHRKFLTPAFHFNILQTFLPVFVKTDKILREKLLSLADGRTVNLFKIIASAALDNVTESIMGVSVDAQKDSESEYVQAIEIVSEIIALRMRNPFVAEEVVFNLSPYKARQDKALTILHGYTNKVIESRQQELKKANITTLNASSELGFKNKHAFLDLLLLAEVDGQKLDNESVREEVDTFMFEGHDTTTSGIVYCLYCLSKHKEIQEKILEEQKSIFGDDLKRDPTYQELNQMKYLETVIKESLRLYPPVPFIQRLITRDTEAAGLQLPKGTSIIIDIFHMQRHPDVFEDPLVFKPERFDKSLDNPYNWIAFSAGPRNCIGQKFAMMEMKVTLSGIVKNFRILPTYDEMELCADLILRSPNGVNIRLLPRN